MIRDPNCHPANEKTAANMINFQLVLAREIWAMKPEKEEKTTMKIDVAAAVFVGIFNR